MRLFIAVDPDEGMRRELIRYMNDLRACGMQGVYTKEENLHLTLAFIGDYGDPQEVLEAMEEAAEEVFTLSLKGTGSFGDLWWAGFKDSEALEKKAEETSAMLEHAFDFMEAAFGESQEMVVFITELSVNRFAAAFIRENDCDRYYMYNKRLLFADREANVRGELDRIRGMMVGKE